MNPMNGNSEILRQTSNSVSGQNASAWTYQQALFSYHSGDFSRALSLFQQAFAQFKNENETALSVEVLNYILRILAEREDFNKIIEIESELTKLLNSDSTISAELRSRTFYVLGICSCYQEAKYASAELYFQKALEASMQVNDRKGLAYAVYGLATVNYAKKTYDIALRELNRLAIILECMTVPDLKSGSLLLRGMILRNSTSFDEALKSLWASYESLKENPSLILYIHTLCALADTYQQMGDSSRAQIYLELASKSFDAKEIPRLNRLIESLLKQIARASHVGEYDFVFHTQTGQLVLKNGQEVGFEGQFVLRELLLTFLRKPGHVFSKEELVQSVWQQSYQPSIHDNKIYVTIKRLRQLLQPSSQHQCLLRAKEGYFLDDKTRVLIAN